MKNMKLIIIGLMMNVMFCGVLAAQTRIAVLPFTPDEKISKAAMSYLTEIFTVEMVNSKKFTVVERARLDAALKEMQMQSGDMFDESSAVELGKMSGAEMVFFGSIFRFGGKELLSIKGMDIKTATLKYAKQEKGGNDYKLEAAVKLMAKQIIEETENLGSIMNDTGLTASDISRGSDKTIIVNGKLISLTDKEAKLYHNDITDKWVISPDNREDMCHYYKLNKTAGIACAIAGGISFGLGFISVVTLVPISLYRVTNETCDSAGYWHTHYEWPYSSLIYPGLGVGIPLMVIGCIVTPLCAIGFSKAKRIKSIYRKTTGQKLTAFLQNSSIDCGYDLENKEVTVAMAIRL